MIYLSLLSTTLPIPNFNSKTVKNVAIRFFQVPLPSLAALALFGRNRAGQHLCATEAVRRDFFRTYQGCKGRVPCPPEAKSPDKIRQRRFFLPSRHVFRDGSVMQLDDTSGCLRHVFIVRDQDDGPACVVDGMEELDYFL